MLIECAVCVDDNGELESETPFKRSAPPYHHLQFVYGATAERGRQYQAMRVEP